MKRSKFTEEQIIGILNEQEDKWKAQVINILKYFDFSWRNG
jgi:hypothetical protein